MLSSLNLRKVFLFLGDITALYLSLLATVFFGFWSSFEWPLFSEHLLPFSALYFCWLIIFYIFGLYDLNVFRAGPLFYTKLPAAILTGLALGMIFFYLFPFFNITPKTNLVLNALFSLILLLAWRRVFYLLFSARFVSRLAIVEDEFQTQKLAKEIINRPYLGYKLATLNIKEDLLSQIKEKAIDLLIVPNNLEASPWLTKNLYNCLPARINFIDWARAYEMICEKIPVSFIAQTWFFENLKEGQKHLYDKAKRISDIILALLLLVFTLPLWGLIALAIKLSDGGSVFYRQKRLGKDKKPFLLTKFRSMKEGAEKETGAVWAKKEDPRVTALGGFFRGSHLDELPQLINILKGEISFVGPRPERPEFVSRLEKEIPYYHIRHLIKPGFTGWAQIKFRYGRSLSDSQEKFQYDLYYLKNRSAILDLGILLKTFQLFFKREQ